MQVICLAICTILYARDKENINLPASRKHILEAFALVKVIQKQNLHILLALVSSEHIKGSLYISRINIYRINCIFLFTCHTKKKKVWIPLNHP